MRATLLLASLLLIQTVSACSLTGDSRDAMGAIVVGDTSIGVHEKWTTSMCALANPADVSAQFVAWIDGNTLAILDRTNGTLATAWTEAGDVALADGFVYTMTQGVPNRVDAWEPSLKHRASVFEHNGTMTLGHGVVGIAQRDGPATSFGVYSLAGQKWLRPMSQDTSASGLIRAVSAEALVVVNGQTIHVLTQSESSIVLDEEANVDGANIDDGQLYIDRHDGFFVIALDTLEVTRTEARDGRLTAAGGGFLAFGWTDAPGPVDVVAVQAAPPTGSGSTSQNPETMPEQGIPWNFAFVLVALGLALARRRPMA